MTRFPQTRWRPAPAMVPTPTVGGGVGALDDVERLPVPGVGPEDVLVDDGALVTGLHDGRIVRVDLDGGRSSVLTSTGGRPLGLEWLPDGDLLVCDAHVGLLRVPRDGGPHEVLASHVGGERLVLTNNAAVEPDGTIWFTESSRCNPVEDFVGDVLEHNRSGRLLRRDTNGEVDEVVTGLCFANGVTLVGDDELWLAETATYTIHRVGRTGPGAGTVRPVTTRLPGYPDNLTTGTDGTVWAPLPNGRNPLADRLVAGPPALRSVVRRLPEVVRPGPTAHAEVLGFAPDGSVRHHLTGTGSACTFLTGAREHDGWLYLGSVDDGVSAVVRTRVPGG